MERIQNKRICLLTLAIAVLALGILCVLESPYNPLSLVNEVDEITVQDSEYARIRDVMEKYKTKNLDVVFDGRTLRMSEMINRANRYLTVHYKVGMNAEDWVEKNCYRTKKGNIIYFKYPEGKTRIMRDVFLEELRTKSIEQRA